MRANRGTIIEPGKDSRFRTRSVAENMKLFEEMAAGKHAEGVHIVRAKVRADHACTCGLSGPYIFT